jgi:hypothetical protein
MQRSLEKGKCFIHDKAQLGFVYVIEHLDKNGQVLSSERVENIIPDPGRDYIMNASLLNGAQYSTWYIGVYTQARVPERLDTLATLLADGVEEETYDVTAGARPTLVNDPLSDGLFSNVGNPAELDFNTSGATVRGGFITSGLTRGTTTGLLLSAVLFPTPKTLAIGETLRVKAGIQLVTA